jgi:hypothetical protein
MNDEVKEMQESQDGNGSGSLKKAVDTLRAHFSSVRVETSVLDGDTALNVRLLGDGENFEERRLLVTNLAECLPPALSILGISPEPKQDGEKKVLGNSAS